MDLSNFERMVLWHQNEILKHVDPNNADQYERVQTVLRSGYRQLYGQLLPRMEDELSEHKTQFVLDVLDMYGALGRVEESTGKKLQGAFSHFSGFDGHGDLVGFAHFFVKELGRYEYLNINNFDAHMPIEPCYERMLAVWFALGDATRRFALSQTDAEAIIAAAPFNAA